MSTRREKSTALESLKSGRPLTKHESAVLATVPPDQLAHIPTESEITAATAKALDAFEIAGAAVEQTLLAKAEAGRMLCMKRASLPHGDWLPFLNTVIPPRYLEREQSGILASAEKAWHREVLRWIKIAQNFDRFPPEALERAHTVRQMLTLADFIPEGGNDATGGHQPTATPSVLVERVRKWWEQQSALLHADEIARWPARDRADLAERLRPVAELYLKLIPEA